MNPKTRMSATTITCAYSHTTVFRNFCHLDNWGAVITHDIIKRINCAFLFSFSLRSKNPVRTDKLSDSVKSDITYQFPYLPQLCRTIGNRPPNHESLSLNIIYRYRSSCSTVAAQLAVVTHSKNHPFWNNKWLVIRNLRRKCCLERLGAIPCIVTHHRRSRLMERYLLF